MISQIVRTFSFRHFSSLAMAKRTLQNKFYVRSVGDEQHFVGLFLCTFDELNIKRQFNFKRNVHEPIEDFISRIKSNIDRIVSKKASKKQKKVKGNEESIVENKFSVDVVALEDGKEVPLELSCWDLFFTKRSTSIKLQILGLEYDVVVNCPWVDSLTLPSTMMVGFLTFPNKADIIYGDISNSRFEWFREDKSDQWVKICDGFCYTPVIGDLGKKLKVSCTPGDGSWSGPEMEIISDDPVISGPGPCPFDERHQFTTSPLGANSVRIMTYNILADVYANTKEAKTELFSYCPSHVMDLDYRKQLYVKEILGYKADIICLQEVDEKVFFNELINVFNDNLAGKYVRKSGTVREGVATFYSTKKFRLIENHRIVVGETGKLPHLEEFWLKLSINSNTDICTRLTELHTSLQILLLERLCEPNHKLVVANTHLYFHPDADHIRLAQGAICMQHLEQYISQLEEANPKDRYTLLFCGDFNSTPDCGFYSLMTSNHVPKSAKDWKSDDKNHVSNIELNQRFPMASAYGTPPFTNYTHLFADCLDYIYYQHSHLELIQAVPLPEESVLKKHTAIPSVVFPSDHLALVADFKIKPV